jgi:endonuclease/exonuclease/phosphatase family metal-dependent hydrolase
VIGGDLNLRPTEQPWAFDELRERFGLAAPTAPDAVDHLLARGLEITSAPRRRETDRREVVRPDGARVRLSDHAPVEARYKVA